MKAVALLALRFCTGLYLMAWAAVKFAEPERAIEISDRFYGGQFSNPVGQLAFGLIAGVVGIFVVLGFLRAFSYSAQALFLGFSAAAVGKTVFEPLIGHFDITAFINAGTDFLPSLTIFVVSLLPFVFRKEDFVALDLDEIGDKTSVLPVEAMAMAAAPVAVAVAAAAAEEESAEPAQADYAAEAVEVEARPSGEPVPEEQAMEEAEAEAEAAGPAPAEADYAAEAVEVEARPSDEPVPEEQAMEEAEAEAADAVPAEAAAIDAVPVEEASAAETAVEDVAVEDIVVEETIVPVAEASGGEAAADEPLDQEQAGHATPVAHAEETAAHTVH